MSDQNVGVQKPKKSWYKRVWVWVLIIIVGFVVLVAVSASKGSNTPTASSSSSSSGGSGGSSSSTAAMPKLNQSANDGKFQFTVTSIKCGVPSVSGAGGYISKTAQGQYCLLNVKANNIGDQAQTLDSSSQYLYDASGKKYSADSEATIDNSPSGDTFYNQINPGNSVSGTVVFDVPKAVTPTIAELHDSAFSNGVKVSLQ